MKLVAKALLICLLGLAAVNASHGNNRQAARKPPLQFQDQVVAQVEEDLANRPKGDSPMDQFEAPFKKAAAVAAAAAGRAVGMPGVDEDPEQEELSDERAMMKGARKDLASAVDSDGEPLQNGLGGLEPGGAEDLAAVPPPGPFEGVEKPIPATIKLIPVELDANDVNDDEGQSPVTSRIFFSHGTLVSENIGKLSAATVGVAALGSVTYFCVCAGRRRRRRNSDNTPLPMTNPWPLQPGLGRRH